MLNTCCQTAVPRVNGKGGGAAQRWYVDIWLHVRTTSGLAEQGADKAELNNYLQAQEWAVFPGYSSIIILNIELFIIFFDQSSVQYTTSKIFETHLNQEICCTYLSLYLFIV